MLVAIPSLRGDPPGKTGGAHVFPQYRTLADGVHQVRLLPGVGQFVFTLYGVPGDLKTVREIVEMMCLRELGNGFDPGPGPGLATREVLDYLAEEKWPVVFYSGAEMQIQGGRSVFGPEQEAALESMDRAGIFTAYQLGEWGYYFHNLSHHEPWWRGVYGREFDTFKHLKRPAGLAGYKQMPESKKECYEVLREYFASRTRDLLGRVISVTGHSHYEAYAAEWGTQCIGLEVGENIAFTQSKLAFARGAARQWGKPWSVQVSPWFGPTCTTRGPLKVVGGIVQGLDAGHSLSFYERMWLHAWFAGTVMVTPENSMAIFFEKAEAPWELTEHGRKASEVFQFVQGRQRGVPYTPVAIVLDHYSGYNGYMAKPWGILTPTPGDSEVRDLFDHQLFPGSDHIHNRPDPENPEASYLRPTPFGEIFDVLLTSVPPEVLPTYPLILLAGDIDFDLTFLSELEKSLRRGSVVLMSERHRRSLGEEFHRVGEQGKVVVMDPWLNPETGREVAISNQQLKAHLQGLVPVEVSGDPVQYSMNRTATGWVVELINNRGVVKRGDQPAVIDPNGTVRVILTTPLPFRHAKVWRSGQVHDDCDRLELELGPGEVEYVEYVVSPE